MQKINFDLTDLSLSDFESYIIVLNKIKELNLLYNIIDISFNKYTRYVYAYLDNSISICSRFGSGIEYLVNSFDLSDEFFYYEYKDAINKLNELQNEN